MNRETIDWRVAAAQENEASMTMEALREYEPPRMNRSPLRLVTLGGTPGEGDSGQPGAEKIPG